MHQNEGCIGAVLVHCNADGCGMLFLTKLNLQGLQCRLEHVGLVGV